ncbi:MAG: cardiolipin synthase [Xanthomonadales bacterium]|jgi:cardiolipin synthase|nr:cardiolipin synthase [Xanthomonadales bacterium]
MITTIVVLLFYLGGIVAAAHAALTTRTAQGAVAWTVSLVSFPFLALPAYLVLGRNKFAGRAELFEAVQDEAVDLLQKFEDGLDEFRTPVQKGSSWRHAVEQLLGLDVLEGNDVELLVNGGATFDSILEGIAGARDYILFQFYMIHDDHLGRQVRDALVERAKAGVSVLVLYDEVGSGGLPGAYVRSLEAAGISVSSFKPTQGRGNQFQLNFRNHRKMVVVDGREGWVGGHNVGDEYLGRDPKFSPWRDTHIRLRGPAVHQLQLVILADWYWATREIPEVNWAPERGTGDGGGKRVLIVPTGPSSQHETASLFFVAAISVARERLWIAAPYFVPDDAVLKALKLAALRGVEVRIITTGKSDSLPVWLAAFHYIHKLRGLGIRFYAYTPGFMHQKVVLIDHHLAYVGSHNFDNRSFRLNFEVGALVDDEPFAGEVAAMFEQDFAQAEPIDPEELEQRGLLWRLGVQLSRLASPVL